VKTSTERGEPRTTTQHNSRKDQILTKRQMTNCHKEEGWQEPLLMKLSRAMQAPSPPHFLLCLRLGSKVQKRISVPTLPSQEGIPESGTPGAGCQVLSSI
jgi:hypothetical protein